MVEFDGVGKSFPVPPALGRAPGVVAALRDVSFAIPAGGVWAVVGPNGAGKSTLFGVLLGFLEPTDGEVRIAGEEPRSYVRRNGAGYLPERFNVPPAWTVRDTLRALARLEGFASREAVERAESALERVALGPHARKPAGTLSRGLLQRLGLAQALLAPRDLVVLDEPTEGLDPLWRIRLRGIIGELKAEGRTVLIASHDLAEVERVAERALLLEDGRVRDILDLGPPAGETRRWRLDLEAASPAVAEAFPGAEAIDEAPGSYRVGAADAAELSQRLAALLEAGAAIVALTPATEGLESRVQRALGRDA